MAADWLILKIVPVARFHLSLVAGDHSILKPVCQVLILPLSLPRLSGSCYHSAMANGERGPKKEYPHRESVRLTTEQKAHLIEIYGSVTIGIRSLIDDDIAAEKERMEKRKRIAADMPPGKRE